MLNYITHTTLNPLLLILLTITSYTWAQETHQSDSTPILLQVLNEISGPNTPGIQYQVVTHNSTLLEYSAGLAQINGQEPLTSNHTLAAFSMTKTLTAIAILQLRESHGLKLNSTLSNYISHPYDSSITIKQLLNHTSGIPNPIPLNWVHLANKHKGFDEDIALNLVLKDYPELDESPGTHYNYSNISYWLLGKVIEKVSGQTYPEYVRTNIFERLDINPTEISFRITNPVNHAKGYLQKWSFMNFFGRFLIDGKLLGDYEGSWLHIKDVYLNGPSFGGAIGSAKAFSRILQDLLGNDSKLLNKENKKLLYSQQTTKDGLPIDMTLGWHMDTLAGEKYYYKEGGGAGFHSEMRIYPTSGIASVVMTNKTSFNSREILSRLDTYFLGYQK